MKKAVEPTKMAELAAQIDALQARSIELRAIRDFELRAREED